MKKLRNCPFCGADVNTDIPCLGVHFNKLIGKWIFSHQCSPDPKALTVDVTVWGKTEEEVVDKWNGEVETSESL